MRNRRLHLAACMLCGLTASCCLLAASLLLWEALLPPDMPAATAARRLAPWWAGMSVAATALFLAWLRRDGGLGRMSRLILAVALAALTAAGGLAVRHFRWEIALARVPSAHDLPPDARGYEIHRLPFRFAASFARGSDVYFVDGEGNVFRADDTDPAASLARLGESAVRPRMIFVSSKGTIFLSGAAQGLLRSADGGTTWRKCLEGSFWRMDQDEAGGVLYAGNYSPRNSPQFHAAVFSSADDGETWRETFSDRGLDHVHTVRFDARHRRLYVADGDGPTRGQLYSDDGGATWRTILSGPKQGHTDVALSQSLAIWGSDDWLGRIVTSPRQKPGPGATGLWCKGQQVWFVAAEGRQVYAGTFAEKAGAGQAAYLLASDDEAATWQKLLQCRSSRAGPVGLIGESRRLSAGGWLYFTTTEGDAWRVRRTDATDGMTKLW